MQSFSSEVLARWRAARSAAQRRAERYALAERTARSRGDLAGAEAERIRRQEAEWDVADLNAAIPHFMALTANRGIFALLR